MHIQYVPKGVCARMIEIEMDGDIIQEVKFIGGCNGNGQGIGALARGMKASDFIERCDDITCGGKSTSCPAQLAKALKEALENR